MRPQSGLQIVFSLLIMLLALATTAQAEVYKSVDKYGNITYTDDPSKAHKSGKVEKINVRSTNVVPSNEPIKLTEPATPQKSRHPDYAIRIVSPENEYTVNPGQRDLIVAVSLQVPLKDDAEIAFYMDGELLGKGTFNNYSIREIYRGEHKLYAQVEAADGQVLSKSDTVTVYVHRVSILN